MRDNTKIAQIALTDIERIRPIRFTTVKCICIAMPKTIPQPKTASVRTALNLIKNTWRNHPWMSWKTYRTTQNPQDFHPAGFFAPPAGLEPATARLTAACSTNWAKEEYLFCYYITCNYFMQAILIYSSIGNSSHCTFKTTHGTFIISFFPQTPPFGFSTLLVKPSTD